MLFLLLEPVVVLVVPAVIPVVLLVLLVLLVVLALVLISCLLCRQIRGSAGRKREPPRDGGRRAAFTSKNVR